MRANDAVSDKWVVQAQKVYNAFPGYTGARPKMQVWHGTMYVLLCILVYFAGHRLICICSDTTLYPQNFWEEIKQWTTVFNYPSTPVSNVSESYLPRGYSNATFGPMFQAILAQNVGHTVPLFEQQYLEFFGIA